MFAWVTSCWETATLLRGKLEVLYAAVACDNRVKWWVLVLCAGGNFLGKYSDSCCGCWVVGGG